MFTVNSICNHIVRMRSPLWLDMAALFRGLRAGRALRGFGSGKRGTVCDKASGSLLQKLTVVTYDMPRVYLVNSSACFQVRQM